jgi:hypothetical protein
MLIPPSHADLVECPPVAALTTIMPSGSPQTSVVWCDFDGEFVRVNTMRGFQKECNMRRNPKVALLCYDPSGRIVMKGPVFETGSRPRPYRAPARARPAPSMAHPHRCWPGRPSTGATRRPLARRTGHAYNDQLRERADRPPNGGRTDRRP